MTEKELIKILGGWEGYHIGTVGAGASKKTNEVWIELLPNPGPGICHECGKSCDHEANRLREDRKARKVVKSSRWLLLRNRENLKQDQRVQLSELLAANRRLMTVYVLKDDLKHLWDYRYEGAARRFSKQWYHRAIRSRIEPLKKFARKLRDYIEDIFTHCQYPLHTGLLEGINNKIKVIKRMAYGYRDDEYFFLKIRQAFPGIRG